MTVTFPKPLLQTLQERVPHGKRVRTAADCSWGCKHFLKLPDPLSFDWYNTTTAGSHLTKPSGRPTALAYGRPLLEAHCSSVRPMSCPKA